MQVAYNQTYFKCMFLKAVLCVVSTLFDGKCIIGPRETIGNAHFIRGRGVSLFDQPNRPVISYSFFQIQQEKNALLALPSN